MDQSVTRTQYDAGTIRKFKRMSGVAALLMLLLLLRGDRAGGVERSAASPVAKSIDVDAASRDATEATDAAAAAAQLVGTLDAARDAAVRLRGVAAAAAHKKRVADRAAAAATGATKPGVANAFERKVKLGDGSEASFSVFGRSEGDHRSLLSEPVEAPYVKTGKSSLIAVCVTGLYRSGTEVMPYIRNSYPKQAHVFVVTNANHSHLWDWVTKYMIEKRTHHQEDGIRICMKLIEQYEQENHLRFDWIARQRIDTIGCFVNGIIWKSVPRSTHLILVPNGGCLCFNNGPCVSDNWALMSRPTLPIYAEEMHGRHGTPENRLYQNLRRKNVSIWTTGIKTAFQMVRTVEFMKTARHKVVISNKSMQYPVSNLSSLKTRWVHYNETVSFSKRLKC
jgi:hypothetical protein